MRVRTVQECTRYAPRTYRDNIIVIIYRYRYVVLYNIAVVI